MFWNVPFRLRDGTGFPLATDPVPWRLGAAELDRFFRFYDHLLVRSRPEEVARLEAVRGFPYKLLVESGPWRLYHRSLP